MVKVFRRFGTLLFLLLAPTLACTIPGVRTEPPVLPTPTPQGDMLFFTAPYSFPLEPGETMPGTQIRYVQAVGELHELAIDGLHAYRQVGDSLSWRGIVAPGVQGTYRLHLQGNFRGQIQAAGEVRLAVLNPAPVEIPPTQTPAGTVYFGGIPISYRVPQGARIPGTTLIYEGEQNEVGELSGTAGYPFFARDDSLIWLGKLRENVMIRYNLRVEQLDVNNLFVGGTAELWVTE